LVKKLKASFLFPILRRILFWSSYPSLSGLPIKEKIAVTGSVNQKGEVQAIGGVRASKFSRIQDLDNKEMMEPTKKELAIILLINSFGKWQRKLQSIDQCR
jgi:hypothetical protein